MQAGHNFICMTVSEAQQNPVIPVSVPKLLILLRDHSNGAWNPERIGKSGGLIGKAAAAIFFHCGQVSLRDCRFVEVVPEIPK